MAHCLMGSNSLHKHTSVYGVVWAGTAANAWVAVIPCRVRIALVDHVLQTRQAAHCYTPGFVAYSLSLSLSLPLNLPLSVPLNLDATCSQGPC